MLRPGPVAAIDHRLLLVEDDDGDAFLVEELLQRRGRAVRSPVTARGRGADARDSPDRSRARSSTSACPTARGSTPLAQLRAAAPDMAIVVLTGLNDRPPSGPAAVAAGAQDYLVKGEVDGVSLGRALRYAVERRQAELGAQQLLLAAAPPGRERAPRTRAAALLRLAGAADRRRHPLPPRAPTPSSAATSSTPSSSPDGSVRAGDR